jgi:hypothetical protein
LKISCALILVLILSLNINAQFDIDNQLKLETGGLSFLASYDSVNFCSYLLVTSKNNGTVFQQDCMEKIISLSADDLDNDGTKEVLIETYTGGAHCCSSLILGRVKDSSFSLLDTVYWGNCGFEVKDLNNDGKKEVIGCLDLFAYFYTNFSQSRFPVIIYALRNNSFVIVNKENKKIIYKDIKGLKTELNEYLKKGFDCIKKKNGKYDAFNTDAGAVQAILAAIVADYQSIGQAEKGYDYVDEVYSCPDKNEFKKVLKKEFKLK